MHFVRDETKLTYMHVFPPNTKPKTDPRRHQRHPGQQRGDLAHARGGLRGTLFVCLLRLIVAHEPAVVVVVRRGGLFVWNGGGGMAPPPPHPPIYITNPIPRSLPHNPTGAGAVLAGLDAGGQGGEARPRHRPRRRDPSDHPGTYVGVVWVYAYFCVRTDDQIYVCTCVWFWGTF